MLSPSEDGINSSEKEERIPLQITQADEIGKAVPTSTPLWAWPLLAAAVHPFSVPIL